jgi:predicted nucleic acid-binding Zn ribbon protein
MMKKRLSEPKIVFERLKKQFGGFTPRKKQETDPQVSTAFGPGRDPGSFAEAMEHLSSEMGWDVDLARAELMEQWVDIVGEDVAHHATPSGASDGVLEILCDSSAWATQLRLMRQQLLDSLVTRFPHANITELSIKAPGAPSWKHGRRSVPGRGPRDTYG